MNLPELLEIDDVPTLTFHPHPPHYERTGGAGSIQVLARQPIGLDRPHPFIEAGAREFSCLLRMPPNEQRAGDIVLVDSTNFTTLLGGTESLETFWRIWRRCGDTSQWLSAIPGGIGRTAPCIASGDPT